MRFGLTSLLIAGASLLATPNFAETGGAIRILIQSSPLAGSQYYKLDALSLRIKAGDRLELVREPENRHDRNAVRVLWQGEPLGYLPRKENRGVAKAMDGREPVYASVESLSDYPDPWKRLRISVFIQF